MLRTREERILETRQIVDRLNELKLSIIYQPIAQLFEHMRIYINDGIIQEVDIPFYEINKKIVGVFETEKNKPCVIKIVEDADENQDY